MKFQNVVIDSPEKWRQYAPPMGKDKQWADGRSAKELANYITKEPMKIPKELEDAILAIKSPIHELIWEAEYVTPFPRKIYGKGEGRNHDMIICGDGLFIGVEAKADEPFDKPLSEWLTEGKSVNSPANRQKRANAMCNLIFGKDISGHENIRYQLLSAMTGVLLEAEKRNLDTAALFILTFKKKGFFKQENIDQNEKGLKAFLDAAGYDSNTEKIKTNSSIANVYVKHITIDID